MLKVKEMTQRPPNALRMKEHRKAFTETVIACVIEVHRAVELDYRKILMNNA